MNNKKAIEMALEALEKDPVPLNAINNAKCFLRQALAQPCSGWAGIPDFSPIFGGTMDNGKHKEQA